MSILGQGHCDTCQWWGGERAHVDDQPWGRCRATPPTIAKARMLMPPKRGVPKVLVKRGEWKWVAFDDWCASYLDKGRTVGL